MELIGKVIGDTFGKLIGHKAQKELARDDRNEIRRKERLEIYRSAQAKLGDLFSEYGQYLADHKSSPNQREHSRIIEAARSEVNKLPTNDTVADVLLRLCPYFVGQDANPEEYAKWGNWDTRNRNALDDMLRHISAEVTKLIQPE